MLTTIERQVEIWYGSHYFDGLTQDWVYLLLKENTSSKEKLAIDHKTRSQTMYI